MSESNSAQTKPKTLIALLIPLITIAAVFITVWSVQDKKPTEISNHDFIYVHQPRYNLRSEVLVENNTIQIRENSDNKNYDPAYLEQLDEPVLYRFIAADKTSQKISAVEIDTIMVDSSKTSPDGFTFTTQPPRSYRPFPFAVISEYNQDSAFQTKDEKYVPLNLNLEYNYFNEDQFIGWVLTERAE